MGTTSHTVSLDEYLTGSDERRAELILGEIFISPSGSPVDVVTKKIVRLLDEAIGPSQFEVNSDLSIIVNANEPASMPRPDVFAMARDRFLEAARQDTFPKGAPEIAVEVVSPGNTKRALLEKIRLYLAYGSSAVWIVYPKKRTVVVWENEITSTEYGEGERIPLPPPLPSNFVLVSEIFAALP